MSWKCDRCGTDHDEPGLCYSCMCNDYNAGKCDSYGHYFKTEVDREYLGSLERKADKVDKLKAQIKTLKKELSSRVQSELAKFGVITNPSEAFLETLAGKGKKVDPQEAERMKANYDAIMAKSNFGVQSELSSKIEAIKAEFTDVACKQLMYKYKEDIGFFKGLQYMRDEILKRLEDVNKKLG